MLERGAFGRTIIEDPIVCKFGSATWEMRNEGVME